MERRLEISAIAPGGEGVSHVVDGGRRRAVFVAKAAPGDVIDAEVDFGKKPARARIVRVVDPSPLRVEPPCSFAERCGGCDLMHVGVAAQLEIHAGIVKSALERAVGGELCPVESHAAPRDVGYRSRARVAISASRGKVLLGYRRSSSNDVEDIASCLVLDAALSGWLGPLREYFRRERGSGEANLALGSAGRPVLDLHWSGELTGAFFGALGGAVESGACSGACVWLKGAREPARIGDPRALTTAADGQPLLVPSGGFAQAHVAMNAKLGDRVLALGGVQGTEVLELFAGSGNFSVLLAAHAAALTTVESDPSAVEVARMNLRSRSLTARVVQADADAFDVPKAVRTVLLDPPRTGAAGASERLARSKVRRVVYVSCDAATLARDVAILVPSGFAVQTVETFEMFPHTSHVESLVVLDRPKRGEA
ncbi:MAG TPA: methyltransferase domain-containing protein [Polyangiaceae bacterium]|nr:methyltransferase domain-containing protein [Polyangiaceae bacterium]